MEKKIFIAILLALRIYYVNSQSFTSKIYDFANDSDSGWKIYATDSTLFVLNGEVCMNNTVYCSGFLAIDYSGNTLYTKNFDTMRVSFSDNMFLDKNLYFSFRSNSLLSENFVLLYQFDLQGNIIAERKFEHFGKILLPLGINKSWDNNLILSLKVENPISIKDTCFFVKLDTNLNTISSITKTESFANIISSILKPSEPGKFVYAQRPGYIAEVHGYVTKIDSTGTEIWKTELPKTYLPQIDVVSDTSGISYVIWQKNYWVTWDTFEYPPVLIKLDKNGQKLWEYAFHSKIGLYLNHIFIARNGDIIGCGVDDDLIENTPSYGNSGGWIFRMSPNGVLKWRRSIADPTLSNINAERLLSGTELPNGDLAFCGDVGYLQDPIPTGISDIWVVRTDSMGCISSDCGDIQLVTSTKDTEFEKYDIKLSPNPTDGIVHILTGSVGLQLDKVDIFDVAGRYLYSEKLTDYNNQINISSLPNGFYSVRIYVRENKVVVKKIIKL